MPRKTPFSGKQKKKQLQEKKSRKQNGPKYLQDSDNEDDRTAASSQTQDRQDKADTDRPPSAANIGSSSDQPLPEVQKINLQPQPEASLHLNANSFRLHFFKEDAQTINRKKKEARKAIKPIAEEVREWTLEDSYPADAKLDFPKRPAWSYASSKEELDRREHKYFMNYVQDVLDQPRAQDLSFFEVNIETWRQLWRVLEMSDILLVIADIRYPVLHIPPRLLAYVMNDLKKQAVVVLNKVDLVSPLLALAWKRYLESKLPVVRAVFFSSNPREVLLDDKMDPASVLQKRPFHNKTLPVGPGELYRTIKAMVHNSVDLSSWEQLLNDRFSHGSHEQMDDGNGKAEELSGKENGEQKMLTIGCVGYPNAGKSSVLNALVGKKVVSVSKSPGHTKHFQTIFLTPTVRLCDCPGLVFPSLVPKSLQVVAGIFPVSQVKEPYSVVCYLAKRLDLPKLLNLQLPNSSPRSKSGGDRSYQYQWSAYDICEAWAVKCGYRTSKAGRPDLFRAANKILRLAVEGQLCLCFHPPNFSLLRDSLSDDPELGQFTKTLSSKVTKTLEVKSDQDEDLDEEEAESSDGTVSESESPCEVESHGMFEQLNIQDEEDDAISNDDDDDEESIEGEDT